MYTFKVGMTCSGCEKAVSRVLSRDERIDKFEVDLGNLRVTVQSEKLSCEEVADILRKTGKSVEIIS